MRSRPARAFSNAAKRMKKPSRAMAAPVNIITMYFQAASKAACVLSKPTSSTENSAVNSMATQASTPSLDIGTNSREKKNRLKWV
jgi:hypothetical protein